MEEAQAMKMEMGMGLNQHQKQIQILAPRMIQSMEILQLPLLSLVERLQAELQSNPVLELREPDDDPANATDGSSRAPTPCRRISRARTRRWSSTPRRARTTSTASRR